MESRVRYLLFLLGRIGLIYQTTDHESLTGAWDKRTNG